MSLSVCLIQLVDILLQMINIMYSGHLSNSVYLSAIAFSISLINIFGFSTLMGFLGALDTLGSQAFGAGNYNLLAHYFNKA